MPAENPTFWKKCSNCKKEIPFKGVYQACSVSTCNHSRRGLYFCSVSCWSAHVPLLRHREAYAIEKTAPSLDEYLKTLAEEEEVPAVTEPKKILMTGGTPTAPSNNKEVLVVVSKLKGYIKERADMNSSADVNDWLSDRLRQLCDQAIENARNDGRKTVMARDFR